MMTTHLCYSVRVDVSGTTADDLHRKALAEAARFFQVDENQLSAGVFEAEPEHVDSDGHVLDWRASVAVRLERR